MTPNFALSLSLDGIRLMHRVAGGWHLVGEVALDDADLTTALKQLRQTALALEPGGLRTKVLLPNDQIKYLAIDTTQTTTDDIHNALNGATPYAIDDLVIDFDRSGGRTHIAAVARETLAEAEAFAVQHKFSPVTFAAVAEPFTFRGEVFFGMTSAAPDVLGAGVVIERDNDPVTVIGHTSLPEPADVSGAMPLTMQAADAAPDKAHAPADDDPVAADLVTETDDTTPTEMPVDDTPVAEDTPDAEPLTTDDAPDEVAEEPVLSFGRAAPSPDDTPDPDPAPSLPEIEEPVFASRFRTGDAEAVPQEPAPSVDTPPEPMFARRHQAPDLEVAEDDAPAVPQPIVVDPEPVAPPPPPVVEAAPMASHAPQTSQAPAPEPAAEKGPSFAARIRSKTRDKTPPAALPAGVGPIGGRQAAAIGGKPRYLGLMLTAGLLVFLALVALWASTLSEDGIAGWLGFGDDAVDVAEDVPPATEGLTEPDIIEVAAAPVTSLEPVTQTPTTPIVTTVPGRVLSPGEADRIYASTGVWQRAPRLPALPQPTTLDDVTTFAAVPAVAPLGRPRDLVRAGQSIDMPFLAPPNPAPAGVVVPRDADGFIRAAASGTVMPNGVLVYARAPRITPPTRPSPEIVPDITAANAAIVDNAPDGVVLIAGQPDIVPPLRPNTLEVPETSEAPETLEVPVAAVADAVAAAAAALPDADANAASDETTADPTSTEASETPALPEDDTATDLANATETPDAATDLDAIAAATLPVDPTLAGFRPSVRPQGLVPEPPYADPELAGLRPSIRPDDLAPPEPEEDVAEVPEEIDETAEPDINSVIAAIAAAAPPSTLVNPTRQAIVASPRPDTRPNNFSRVVASAQQNAARNQPAAPAAAAAPAATAPAVASSAAVQPTGPVPQGVAAAATIDSAINLRNVNLIGVYGRPNNRRALIRLSNGRYVKVEIGSSFQGGRITAIGDNALNYVVSGQTYSLQVPSG